MNTLHASVVAGVLVALTGTAVASSGSLVEFKSRVMPVVVQVNAQGKVTDILPSRQLPPGMSQLLVEQLDAWIAKPATVKGRPVASRFIAEVALRANPREDGKYDASFVYVKGLPMPFGGAVHWNVIDGGLELALVSDEARGTHRQWRMPFDAAGYPRNSIAAMRMQQATAYPMGSAESAPAAAGHAVPVNIASPAAAPRSASAPGTEIR